MREVSFWVAVGLIGCCMASCQAVGTYSGDRAMVDLAKYELQARELDIRENEINCVK